MVLSACSSSEGSWIDILEAPDAGDGPIFEMDELVGGAGGFPAAGGCLTGVDDEAPASAYSQLAPVPGVERGVGNDPFTATGARQVPGPNMVVYAPPADPVTVRVARPADPDEHVAARKPDRLDTGPVPDPKLIGRDRPALDTSAGESSEPGAADQSCDPGASP